MLFYNLKFQFSISHALKSLLKIALVIVVGCVQSCETGTLNSQNNNENLAKKDILNSKNLDSLFFSIANNNDPILAYKNIDNIIQNIKFITTIKDTLTLAKAHYVLARQYMIGSDWENSRIYLVKAKHGFQLVNRWEEVTRISKGIARIYRKQGKVNSIEQFLKKNIDEIKKANINSFAELDLVHELTVHYGYDLGKHGEAVAYGELFFERLSYFDSIYKDNPRFKNIKEYEKDVIDLTLGVSYLKQNQIEKSYNHLNKALINYTKRNDTEKLNRVHKALIEYYLETGDKKKLIYHKEEYYKNTLKFINTFSESQKEINALKIKLLEEEQEFQALQEENKFKSMLFYLAIAGLLIVTLFWRYRSKMIREKRTVALQLEKQYEFNEFKTNLLITVAHELRTPLTIILGHLQLITDKKIKQEKFKLYFNKIKDSSEGILNKMSDIINLLKEDVGEKPAEQRKIEIKPYLKGLFFSFEGVARIKKIKLVFNFEIKERHIISTDPKILGGLLNNLIVNAIKFSPSNTIVEMRVQHNIEYLSIAIIDQGIGIKSEDQEKIFDKFKRVSKTIKVDGFGIGLAIVKKSSEKLGGKINLKSNLGEGSTFTLLLPNKLCEETEQQKPLSIKKAKKKNVIKAGQKHQKSKLLVVEDNPEMSSFYEHIFSDLFDCTFAFDGREGIDILRSNTFDIIISDVMMPGIDGFEFKENIRAIPGLKNIPFVLVTAKDQDESKIQAFEIGVDDYVVKPFNKNELIARIKALIANKKEREKWAMTNKNQNTSNNESFDVKTIRKLRETVLKHCNDENFGVLDLANEIGMSQRQLVKVTKKLTGLTPVKFILEIRLLEAYKKIKNREEADINNVRFSVGIQSASYFSTQFKNRFGLNPKEFMNSQEVSINSINDF